MTRAMGATGDKSQGATGDQSKLKGATGDQSKGAIKHRKIQSPIVRSTYMHACCNNAYASHIAHVPCSYRRYPT